jgi:hypothetical protein
MHLEQLYTGIANLMAQGRISVSVKMNPHPKKSMFMQDLGEPCIKLRLENGPMILFDVHDHFSLLGHESLLDDVDIYFKRSYQLSGYDEVVSQSKKKFKVLPLGFNYSVYGSNNFLLKRIQLQEGLKKKIEWFCRGNSLMANIFRLNTSIAFAHEKYIHQLPQKNKPSILLMTRLWSTETVKDEYKKEIRLHLNNRRTDCIRALKKEFKENFTGGLFIDAFSKKTAADILLDNNKQAAKKQYLQQLRQHNIGVTVNGKFSAGWSFGENIACSNSIVADGLTVKVPGDFLQANNFLKFDNAEECVAACERLFSDKAFRETMQENNLSYYNQYLKPEILIWNAIQTALQD